MHRLKINYRPLSDLVLFQGLPLYESEAGVPDYDLEGHSTAWFKFNIPGSADQVITKHFMGSTECVKLTLNSRTWVCYSSL